LDQVMLMVPGSQSDLVTLMVPELQKDQESLSESEMMNQKNQLVPMKCHFHQESYNPTKSGS